jgi:hypothetical protein
MQPVNQAEWDKAHLGPSDAAAAKVVAEQDRKVEAGRPGWALVARGAKVMALQAHQARQPGMYQQALDVIKNSTGGHAMFSQPVPDMSNRLLRALFEAGKEAPDAIVAQAEIIIAANPGKRLGDRR